MRGAALHDDRDHQIATVVEPIDYIDLSRQFVTRYYRHQFDWCLAQCAPGITFIGTSPSAVATGREDFDRTVRAANADLPQGLVGSFDASATTVAGSGATLVSCRFLLASDPLSGRVRATQKRGTLLWDTTDGRPSLLHLHFSTPLDSTSTSVDDTSASETYRYAKVILDQLIRRSAVTVRDTSGTQHYLSATEVRYVEASRQRTLIHCLERTIAVRRGFKDLVEAFEEGLVPVHRSFAVCPLYVWAIRSDGVLLDDGTEIPIPRRRTQEVRARLQQAVDHIEGIRRSRDASLAPATLVLDQPTAANPGKSTTRP